MVVSAPAAGQPSRAIRRSVPAHGGSASADRWAGRRHARDVVSACARLRPARRASGGRSVIGTAEKAGADRPGMTAGPSDGGARRRGSPAWSCLGGPHQTEPGVRLSCGWNIEVDAGDYPGGAPQNGQQGRCCSRQRATTMRRVAIEWGLCRSGRTRRPARAEVRRRLRG